MFPIIRVKLKQTLALTGTACLLIPIGCSEPASTTQKTLTAIADYESRLQNLAPYTIESCEITITSFDPGGVPIGPNDISTTLTGFAILGPDSLSRIQGDFEWEPRNKSSFPIPEAFADILPSGADLLWSYQLDKTFRQNPRYQQGYVILELQEEQGVLYIYADRFDG